jgi:hypothetical protein
MLVTVASATTVNWLSKRSVGPGGHRRGTMPTKTSRGLPKPWQGILTLLGVALIAAGLPILLELGFAAATPDSSDYSSDSLGTYTLANVQGSLLDVTPRDLHDHPDLYARKLVRIRHVVARTLNVDSHLGGLQGSAQFLAFAAAEPEAPVLLHDDNSYGRSTCGDRNQSCLTFLGDRMETTAIGGERTYDLIEGRWLPVSKYPLKGLSKQPSHPFALWVGVAHKP